MRSIVSLYSPYVVHPLPPLRILTGEICFIKHLMYKYKETLKHTQLMRYYKMKFGHLRIRYGDGYFFIKWKNGEEVYFTVARARTNQYYEDKILKLESLREEFSLKLIQSYFY